MTTTQAFLLGLLQGFTEFFPVSSSGHLVLAEHVFGLHIDPLSLQGLNSLLHAGTLVALLLVYWKRWYTLLLSPFTGDKVHQKLLLLLVIATIPAAAIGLLFEEVIAERFSTVPAVSTAFIVTAIILILGERATRQKRTEHLNTSNALTIGIAQALALAPGLSRSGLTISASRLLGLTREEALDFSFLMATPVIGGAVVMALSRWATEQITLPHSPIVFVGFVTSLASSLLAILFLRRFVTRHSLSWFSIYLVFLSLVLLAKGV